MSIQKIFVWLSEYKRNKIHDLRLIIHDVPIDYFVISETKLDNSFPNAQLTINKDKHGRGVIELYA